MNAQWVCDSISEKIYLGLNIDVDLFKELKVQSLKYDLPMTHVIENFVRIGLKDANEVDKMYSINVPNDIMEKINNRCKELNCNPEKLIHSILFDYLKKVEDVPSTVDREKMMAMLDQDNPEGDDILEKLKKLSDVDWD